jgi:uncharacterized protein
MANNVRGKFLWHELMTSDTGSAEDFYSKVVGWKAKAWEQDPSYKMWMMGKRSMGGLMPQRVEPGQKSPLQWFTYIGTPDVDATVRQAVELGGRVMRPAWDIPNVGRLAFLQDPQGAAFAVITPQPQSPPPGGDERPGAGDFSWHELITSNWQAAWDFYQKLFGWEKPARWKWDRARRIRCSASTRSRWAACTRNRPISPARRRGCRTQSFAMRSVQLT